MLKLINTPLLNNVRLYSSKRWLTRQNNDHFVKLAKESDFRARSCFKLIEILDKYSSDFEKLKQNPDGANVLDLGCAPGSWCQVIKQRFPKSNVVGVDLLECTPLQNVKLLKGDFTTLEAQQEILKEFEGKEIDLVVSDMAPSFSGNFIY
jgi:23S rRNA (uridine2552-2'-O)-methyltransferase